jgi:uncharacterized membrane protein
MEVTPLQAKHIRLYFRISILLKGAFSMFEIIGGLLAFFIPVSVVTDLVVRLTQGELSEEPGDFIASHLVTLAQQFSYQSSVFIALYLLSRGIIKLILVVALLKNQLWAYPSSLFVLALFVVYQLFQIVATHSMLLVALTIFDLVVMWFIWEEYQLVRSTQ